MPPTRRHHRPARRIVLDAPLLLGAVLLAGCAARAPSPPPGAAGAPPGTWYEQAARTGQAVQRIDPGASLIAITVRRAGPLARLGHDHVVASHTIEGYVDVAAGRADFQFRADQLTVDEADLRRQAGLDTTPSPEAVDGTRQNMLNKVIEAARYPLVLLHAERAGGGAAFGPAVPLRLTITLHGVTRSMVVPTDIASSAGATVASGSVALLQSDFGMTPMSVLGGAIRVEDRIELRFRLVAR